MRSTEETMTIERKLNEAKKVIRKIEKESYSLNQKLETLEQANKMFKVENDKLSEASNALQSGKNGDLETIDENRNTEPRKEVEVSNETCTICSMDIPNYEPEFFQDVEINPACEECKFQDFSIREKIVHC